MEKMEKMETQQTKQIQEFTQEILKMLDKVGPSLAPLSSSAEPAEIKDTANRANVEPN